MDDAKLQLRLIAYPYSATQWTREKTRIFIVELDKIASDQQKGLAASWSKLEEYIAWLGKSQG